MKHLYIILFILPLIGFGQGWEMTYSLPIGDGNGQGWSVEQTIDGGYVVVGMTSPFSPNSSGFILKTDENGEEEWVNVEPYFPIFDCQTTIGGGYLVGGIMDLDTGWTLVLQNIDSQGNTLWWEFYDEVDVGMFSIISIQQTNDGGYIINVGGGTTGTSLLKITENGTQQWVQSYDIYYNDNNDVVQPTIDGGYIICGGYLFNQEEPCNIIKTDSLGNEEWCQYYDVQFQSIKQTVNGDYIVCGYTPSFGNDEDIVVSTSFKLYENGYEEWSYQTPNDQVWEGSLGRSIIQTIDGNYVMLGWLDGVSGGYLIKIDENGYEEWSQTYDWWSGNQVIQVNDGGYVVSGRNFDNYSVLLIKTDPEGNVTNTSTIELPIPTRKRELIKTTNILGQENTTIKNQPMIEIYDDGSTEKKIVLE